MGIRMCERRILAIVVRKMDMPFRIARIFKL